MSFFRAASDEKPEPLRVLIGIEDTEPLPQAQTERYLEELSGPHRKLVAHLTYRELLRLGYGGVEEDDDLWLDSRDRVVSNLIRHDVDLDELAAAVAAKTPPEAY